MWEKTSLLGFIFLLIFLWFSDSCACQQEWIFFFFFRYNLQYQNYQYSKLWLRYIFPQQTGKCSKSRLQTSKVIATLFDKPSCSSFRHYCPRTILVLAPSVVPDFMPVFLLAHHKEKSPLPVQMAKTTFSSVLRTHHKEELRS